MAKKLREVLSGPEIEDSVTLGDAKESREELDQPKWLKILIFILAGGWIFFQIYIIYYPTLPMIQRPLHLVFAISLVFLLKPLKGNGSGGWLYRIVDLSCVAIALLIGIYFILSSERILDRMTFVDNVTILDVVFCTLLVILLIEGTRRAVGLSLVLVIIPCLVYGWFGNLFPGWLYFRGIGLKEYTEILFLGTAGIFGVPLEASLIYVFYFIAFGAIFGALGGSSFLIDLSLRFVRKQVAGSRKAAIVASGAMGTISGSGIANVMGTGVFTIPFMIKSGYDRDTAGATEAIASSGGQIMPPVMGAGAFIMAELLGIPYSQVALAAMIPAILFYFSLYCLVDFEARKTGIGIISANDIVSSKILPRIHLFIPIIVLVWYIIKGYSPTIAATLGCVAALAVSFLRKETRPNLLKLGKIVQDIGKQAASIAVPIGAIGIIIAVAVHSNLVLKFTSNLIDIGANSLFIALILIIFGLIILGMGVPTVAAYIMGAIFFVPILIKFGFIPLAAHLFVFYYSVLGLVTPPVALCSYAAAGLANGNVTKTGIKAFIMSLVAFFIPFVFLFDTSLLCIGPIKQIIASAILCALGVVLWSAAVAGFLGQKLTFIERGLFTVLALLLIWPHHNSLIKFLITVPCIIYILWLTVLRPKLRLYKIKN